MTHAIDATQPSAPSRPPSRRRQWWGAAIIAGVAAIFLVVVPVAARAAHNAAYGAGAEITVQGSLTFTIADGWSLPGNADDFIITLENSGATYVPVGATSVTDSGTAQEQLDLTRTALEGDASTVWIIGDDETLTTDAGDTAVTFTAHSEDSVQQVWVISNGTMTSIQILTAPDAVWAAVKDTAEQMAMSVTFLDAGSAS